MGYRTVVMLNNDFTSDWSNDPYLGKTILDSANSNNSYKAIYSSASSSKFVEYGRLVECAHADTSTLAVLGNYHEFTTLSRIDSRNYKGKEPLTDRLTNQLIQIDLLKKAADSLGYRLVKKQVKKPVDHSEFNMF